MAWIVDAGHQVPQRLQSQPPWVKRSLHYLLSKNEIHTALSCTYFSLLNVILVGVNLTSSTYIHICLFVVNGNSITDFHTEEIFKKYGKFHRHRNGMQNMWIWHWHFQLQDSKKNFAQLSVWGLYSLTDLTVVNIPPFPLSPAFFCLFFKIFSLSLINVLRLSCGFILLYILKRIGFTKYKMCDLCVCVCVSLTILRSSF